MVNVNWKPIGTGPYNQVVLLSGDSGYAKPHNTYVTSGFKQHVFHDGAWNDMCGDPITDQLGEPKYWTEMINLPGKETPNGIIKKNHEKLQSLRKQWNLPGKVG